MIAFRLVCGKTGVKKYVRCMLAVSAVCDFDDSLVFSSLVVSPHADSNPLLNTLECWSVCDMQPVSDEPLIYWSLAFCGGFYLVCVIPELVCCT